MEEERINDMPQPPECSFMRSSLWTKAGLLSPRLTVVGLLSQTEMARFIIMAKAKVTHRTRTRKGGKSTRKCNMCGGRGYIRLKK